MTLDSTQPTDQVQVQELPEYIRAGRAAINALIAGDTEITFTELILSSGTTTLAVGTDLTAVAMEVVLISSLGASPLAAITGGTKGQIKIFIFQDNDVSFTDGPKSSGQFYLNQLPVLTTFNAQLDDVLILVNINGDGSSNNGYWKELFRKISVK